MSKGLMLFFIILSLISTLLLGEVFNNYTIIFVLTIILSIFLMCYGHLSPSNPLVWYVFFVNIYHLGICILYYIGFRTVTNVDSIITINVYALIGFLVSTFFFIKHEGNVHVFKELVFSLLSIKLSLVLILCLSLFVPVSFILSGAQTKAEFTNSFGSFFGMLNVVFSMFLVKLNHKPKWWLFFMTLYIIFVSLLLGERNILLSYAVMIMIVAYHRYGMSLKKTMVISLLMISLIPILGLYKNIFTRDNFNESGNLNPPIIIGLLNGEFRSAGFNIERIVDNKDQFELKYGTSLINNLIRSVIPGFIYKVENSIFWYNNTFHKDVLDEGRGYGFSLAAEGYINFGYLGVVIWFFLAGLIINSLYVRSLYSCLFLVIYSSSIPIFIYSLRGDFSTIISPFFKQIFFTIILVAIVDKYLKVNAGVNR
ncbi:oligosaccharide repeat unit polymerase [Vibrio metschnikovii]|nr:oligosaccharide repeat unit polymerase [Vibrio metschnikovii]